MRLVRPAEQGGYGLNALWNDDFHHAAMVRLSGRREAYYSDYRGTPQEFISAVKVRHSLPGTTIPVAEEASRHAVARHAADGASITLHSEPRPDRQFRARAALP